MRIIHISTSDTGGGAARAAYRVHTGLLRRGHDSRMKVLKKWSVDQPIDRFFPSSRLTDRIRAKLRDKRIRRDFDGYTRPAGGELFTDDRTPWREQPLRDLPDCDIVNFHWVAGFLDFEGFFEYFQRVRPDVPLVWRMADMAPVTAGCHYDQGCGRFVDRCGACPALGSTREDDLSRQSWHRRHDALARIPDSRLHLVGPSRWIGEQARKSSLLGRFNCTIIPNALDTKVFQPRDRGFSRQLLDLPQDARIVLFAADSAKHPRKGWAQLAAAVEGIEGLDDLVLVAVGGKAELAGRHRLINVGRIDDDRVLSMAYSAADLFIIPSLQESFGQTAIEAMACGVPVIGFASGGIKDTVRPGITGELVPVGDVDALRAQIVALLQDEPRRRRMSQQCREVALADYAIEVQAAQYESLYQSLTRPTSSPVA